MGKLLKWFILAFAGVDLEHVSLDNQSYKMNTNVQNHLLNARSQQFTLLPLLMLDTNTYKPFQRFKKPSF